MKNNKPKFVRIDPYVMEIIKDLANIKERSIQDQIDWMLRDHEEFKICEGK